MSPLAATLTCIGIVLTALGIIIPLLLVVLSSVRKLGILEGVVTSAITELRKIVDELRDGFKQLVKIPDLERRISALEDALGKLTRTVHSTDKQVAITKEQIAHEKERRGSRPEFPPYTAPIPRREND